MVDNNFIVRRALSVRLVKNATVIGKGMSFDYADRESLGESV